MNRFALVACLFALPTVACAVTRGEEDVTTDSAELRRLLPSELIGSISYGQSKTVSYTAEPRYRALSFQATQGDNIEARFVGAKGLDTVGFVLSDSFATLAQNDDESSATRSSRVSYAIKQTGTYYLAVREANEEDGEITFSLAKVGGAQPPPPKEEPPTPADVFSPKSCTGSVLTQARAIKYFPKGAATGSVTISDKPGRAYLRARVCSEFSGCADWVEKDVTQPQNTAALRGYNGNTAPGIVQLKLSDRANDPIDVLLTVSNGVKSSINYNRSLTTHRLALTSYTAPKALKPTSYQTWSNDSFRAGEESWELRQASLEGYLDLPVGEDDLDVVRLDTLDWQTTLTESCVQARFSTVKVSAGQQQRVEMQGVVHWDLTTPAK